jgi:hypothetical protein
MKNSKEKRLGVDIGRVIISAGSGGKEDTAFLNGTLEDALRTPPMDGAFEQLKQLAAAFEGRVWLVSKCGPKVQAKTKKWLAEHKFKICASVSSARRRRITVSSF